MRTIRFALLALLLASPAAGQIIDGYRLNIYNAGAGPAATPMQTFDFLGSATTCDLAPSTPAVGVPVNPTRAVWDDPLNTGRICQWTDPGTGPLFALPVGGNFEAGLQAFNAAGRGPESNRASFSRLAAPGIAPTGLRLIRVGS